MMKFIKTYNLKIFFLMLLAMVTIYIDTVYPSSGSDMFLRLPIGKQDDTLYRAQMAIFKKLQKDTEKLFLEVLDAKETKKQQELRKKLEVTINELHKAIPQEEINAIKELGRQINQGNASILALYEKLSELIPLPLLKHIKGGASWKMSDGTYMDAEQHNREFMREAMTLSLQDEDTCYNYFNDRRESGSPILNRENFHKLRDRFQSLAGDPFVFDLTLVLHDYGKLIEMAGHPEHGARLVRSLLERLVPEEHVEQIVKDIREHVGLFGIASGEYMPELDANMRQRLLILQVIDSSSVGPGHMTDSKLRQFLVYVDGYEGLRAKWAKARILRFLYINDPDIVLNADIDKTFQEHVINLMPEIWDELKNLGVTERFLDFLNKVKFAYAFDIHQQLDARTLIKWLFMLFTIDKSVAGHIDMIQYVSTKTGQDVSSYVSKYSSIKDIQDAVQAKDLQTGKVVDILPGLPVELEVEKKNLLIHTEAINLAQLPQSSSDAEHELGKLREALKIYGNKIRISIQGYVPQRPFYKAIRDNILTIIIKDFGEVPVWMVLDEDIWEEFLVSKLFEEFIEFNQTFFETGAVKRNVIIEEVSDMLEIVDGLNNIRHWFPEGLTQYLQAKDKNLETSTGGDRLVSLITNDIIDFSKIEKNYRKDVAESIVAHLIQFIRYNNVGLEEVLTAKSEKNKSAGGFERRLFYVGKFYNREGWENVQRIGEKETGNQHAIKTRVIIGWRSVVLPVFIGKMDSATSTADPNFDIEEYLQAFPKGRIDKMLPEILGQQEQEFFRALSLDTTGEVLKEIVDMIKQQSEKSPVMSETGDVAFRGISVRVDTIDNTKAPKEKFIDLIMLLFMAHTGVTGDYVVKDIFQKGDIVNRIISRYIEPGSPIAGVLSTVSRICQ